jgi:hypothetical protein
MNSVFPRAELVDAILVRPEPIVVLEASAGMGKSILLRQIAQQEGLLVHADASSPVLHPGKIVLWDVPPHTTPDALPEQLLSGQYRAIIAKRPETKIPGLARALAYGAASVVDPELLLICEREAIAFFGAENAGRILDVSGGWPLVAFRPDGFGNLSAFLQLEFLHDVPDKPLVDLSLLAHGAHLLSREDNQFFPIARVGQDGRIELAVRGLAVPLKAAVEAVMTERLRLPAGTNAIADAYAQHGKPVEAIAICQHAGFYDKAYQYFHQAGGLFFLYYHGPDAFDRVLSGFPLSYAHQSEVLVLSFALQALKRGDISRARRLLVDRFGDYANDFEAVFSSRSIFSREFREFRFLMLIYEDYQFSEEMLKTLYAINAEFPGDAHLFRGSFYNSVLEFYIRRRQFAEAERWPSALCTITSRQRRLCYVSTSACIRR